MEGQRAADRNLKAAGQIGDRTSQATSHSGRGASDIALALGTRRGDTPHLSNE